MTGYHQLVQRKIGLFGKDLAERRPNNDGQRNADDNDGQENAVVLEPLEKMLFGGRAFAELCSAIKYALYSSDPPYMSHVEESIRHSLSSLPPKVCKNCQLVEPSPTQDSEALICADHAYPYSVTLQTDWKALEFLHAEFEKEVPSLGAVMTYAGVASEAFATTCSQYLRDFWPSNSTALLDVLDSLLLSRRTSKVGQSNEKTALPATPQKYALKARLSDSGEVSIEAHGTAEFLVQVAQQLAWITSALRSSTSDKNMHLEYSPILEDDTPEEENASRLKYCFATILPTSEASADSSSGGDPSFAVKCHFQEIPEAERSCWFDLVSGDVVIAANFPVPARRDEKGLEIPMGILAKIAVIQDAIEYKGGIVMKGPTSMLVPIKYNTELDIIQWHVVSASNKRKRLTYIEGVEKCKQRALIDEVDLQSILRSRAIVGWWNHAKSRLGDEDINFTNLRWSTAELYEPLRIQNIAAGLQNIGVLNIECAPGRKDSGYLVKFEGPYSEMLSTAKGEKAFLYDTLQQRAWLVTWDEVILHIIRKRNSDRPFVHNGAPVKIPTMGPATQTLFLNQKLVLVDDEDKPETLRLTAIRIFNQLETLAAIDDNRRQAPEKAIDVPGVLIGHEFMSIVERTVGRETKKNEIKLTSGGWTRLVRHSASLVLFANGFDDLICPTANTENLCTRWKTVPWGKDYLAATTDTLLRLYFRGNEGSQEYLTSKGLCWHKRHSVKLFETCPEPTSNKCGCSRLQQIVPKPMSDIGAVDRPRTVSAGGGVIFGTENAITKGPLSTVLRTKKDAAIYSQPNLQIEGKVTCEDDALIQFKEDNAVFQQALRQSPLSIESGSMTTAQTDRTSPSSKVRTKEAWIKRSVEAEGNGPVGKRQRY
ncbi:hypothetical protein LZ31DRAFT_162702 [Colletotrichum somersetense]|nr:hypothetical protein LZ31DRAFT_162702 [Colletotrichum somersetense]